MNSDYQRLNETQLSNVSAIGQSLNSENSGEVGAVPQTSVVKMQNPKIERKEFPEMIKDASNKGEQIQEDTLEYNEITEKENGLRMPTECDVELDKLQECFETSEVTIPNEEAVIK